MKKLVVVIGLFISAVVVGYTLDITLTDIFSAGNNGSGGPLVRMDSDGQIITAAGITAGTTSTFTGVATFTVAPVSVTGKYGFGPLVGSTIYTVKVATTIAANGTYTFTLADGKAGSYTIHSGTHTTSGTFTSAAAVSISTVSSADLTPIAVTDGGTSVLLTNGAAATKTYMITYDYVN